MNRRIAILCPGQGAQHAQMFRVLGMERHDACGLAEALGMPVAEALADPALLYANRLAQPLLVAATLAAWEAARPALPQQALPVLAAGYSIGEVSAHAVAGALAPAAAVALAAQRAQCMDDCMRGQPAQGLLAVSGLHGAALAPLLRAHGLHPAILTGEDGCIVGGARTGFAAFEAAAAAAGARINVLPVEVASHTPLLEAAVAPLRALLSAVDFEAWRFPVLAGISAEPVAQQAAAVDTLARQVAQTIRWMDCMDAVAEAGVAAVLELGPGAALARMFQARHPGIPCRSVADFRSQAGLRTWLERQMD